ncbi:MAG: TIGR02147 family protein [Fibrobacterales bacterium]
MRVSIYNYWDYQEYLVDWLVEAKKKNPRLSYQKLADRAGVKSKAYMHKIFTGARPLTLRSLPRVALFVAPKKKEERYLGLMIQYKHADSVENKKNAYEAMQHLMNPEVFTIERDTYAYFRKWYHPVIRELICSPLYNGDVYRLGRLLSPSISGREVQSSIDLLNRLDLITEESGEYRQTSHMLRTNNTHVDFVVVSYMKELMELGQRALEEFPPEDRYVVSVTAGVSKKSYTEINRALHECRNIIENILQQEEPIETVCQINMQYFSLLQPSKSLKSNTTEPLETEL